MLKTVLLLIVLAGALDQTSAAAFRLSPALG